MKCHNNITNFDHIVGWCLSLLIAEPLIWYYKPYNCIVVNH